MPISEAMNKVIDDNNVFYDGGIGFAKRNIF
jgi:hypothetical protein